MLGINLTKRVQDLYAKAAGGRSDRGLRELEGPTAPGMRRATAKTPAHPSPLPRFHAAPAKTPAGLCADTDRAALKPRDVQANHRTPNHGREQSSAGSVTQFYSFRYNHRSRAAWAQARDPAGRTRHKRGRPTPAKVQRRCTGKGPCFHRMAWGQWTATQSHTLHRK